LATSAEEEDGRGRHSPPNGENVRQRDCEMV
jgi:hypothetical protein